MAFWLDGLSLKLEYSSLSSARARPACPRGPCQYRDAVAGCAYKRAERSLLSIRNTPRLTRTVVWFGGLLPDSSLSLVGNRLKEVLMLLTWIGNPIHQGH